PVRPWLFAFVFRCASDWRRLARHRVELLGAAVEPAAPTARADDALAHQEDLRLVLDALETMDMDRRAIFILVEIDECPVKDAAQTFGVPLFTARSEEHTSELQSRSDLV